MKGTTIFLFREFRMNCCWAYSLAVIVSLLRVGDLSGNSITPNSIWGGGGSGLEILRSEIESQNGLDGVFFLVGQALGVVHSVFGMSIELNLF